MLRPMIMNLHRYIYHDWQMTPNDFQVTRSKDDSREDVESRCSGVMKFDKVLTKKFSSGSTPVTKKIQDGAWTEITEKVNSVGRACRTIDDVKGAVRSATGFANWMCYMLLYVTSPRLRHWR
ncbi:hypothetical protein DPMN_037724, partial [Dreissena polymorpha]